HPEGGGARGGQLGPLRSTTEGCARPAVVTGAPSAHPETPFEYRDHDSTRDAAPPRWVVAAAVLRRLGGGARGRLLDPLDARAARANQCAQAGGAGDGGGG